MAPIPNWLEQEINDYFIVPITTIPKTVLDIGANIGAFALRAHREWPVAKVICYEPMPFNIEQLRQNTSTDWCLVESCAVSATSGEKDIYVGDMFVTGGFTKGVRQTNQRIRVQCIAASSLPSCDLLKIDTEGSEMEILQNVDLKNTKVIMLEHHSIGDAATIKQMLRKEFQLVHDESDREVGTEIFFRLA
jgi:FkbM family methyltransferase